jgi:hypothetical protein
MGAGTTRSACCCSCHQLRIAETLEGGSVSVIVWACTSIMLATLRPPGLGRTCPEVGTGCKTVQ